MIRLVIVDDHLPSRQQAVADLSAGDIIDIVSEAETSDECYKMCQQLLPDIVLLDLHLPGLITTHDLIKRLNNLKNVRVIVWASQGKASEVQDLLDMGAAAYVLKSDPVPLVRMSIVMVNKGSRNIISPSLQRNITKMSLNERNILKHVTKRGGVPKAAERMGISEYDLTHILDHMAEKLELEDADKLVKWAKKNGF